MHLVRQILSSIIALFFTMVSMAQTFEFTENKGQWNPAVRYKGELSIGAFFLTQNGYRVLQHHPGDYARAMEYFSGHYAHTNSEQNAKMHVAGQVEDVTNGGGGGKPDDLKGPPVRSHAYDVLFVGANPAPAIQPEKPMNGYSNYFIGNDSSRWAREVKSWSVVTYAEMYPGVDVRYYSDEGYLKYDMILKPGARPERLVLKYDAAELKTDKEGNLVVKTSVSEVKERAPYAYQWKDGKRITIDCRYQVVGNTVRFKMGNYDPNTLLIIDPTLVFSTFAGSTSDNWGYTATYDFHFNAFGGGIVFGNGWPITPGAHQSTFGGGGNTGEGSGFDIGLMKLNQNGTQRLFSTYLGGSGNEQPHSLVVDLAGNLVVAGRTTSANFVTTTPRIGPGGSWDIIVTKFSPTGALLGSAVIGGSADDGVNIKHKNEGPAGPESLFQNYGDDARSEVVVDRDGNIYLASCTESNNFPVTAGVLQTTRNGDQDALVLKFSPSVTPIFATYLGGSNVDAAYVIYVDRVDNTILVAGGTASSDFPGDKTGTVGPTYGGSTADGFVARLNGNGTALLKSAYIGTSGIDQVYGLQEDRLGFVYVMGINTGLTSTNFPIVNAPFNQPGGKQFVAKLQPDFSAFVFSTVFGPPSSYPNISPTAFLVDRCENIYVSGWGGKMAAEFLNSGTTGMPITTDAIDPTTDGKDFYFIVIEKDAASQLYGTFFGQQDQPTTGLPDHVDGGTSRFDPLGVIYQGICANCSSGQFPTTPGVVAPSKPAGANCNLAVIKISFDLSGVISGIKSAIDGVDGDTSACAPALVDFRDTIAIAQTYNWLFGDGTPEVTTTAPNISHAFSAAGTYRVRLIAVDENRCFPRDTSYVNIRVRTDRVTVNANAVKLDPCQSNAYRFENLSTVIPSKPFSSTSFTWNFGDNSAPVLAGNNPVNHQFPAPGTYTVKLVLNDTNYCNAPDSFSITLRVSPQVTASFTVQNPGCAPYQAQFNNTSAGGQSFFWTFGNGQTSTAINPTALYLNPGTYQVKLVASDPSTCNLVDSITQTLTVLSKLQADFSFTPNPSEENIPTTFTNLSAPAIRYKWLFGDGDSLITLQRDTLVKHQYTQSGSYNVCLITFSDIGCNDTLCRPLNALVNPMVDVVTAFSPNNDGTNDRAVVIGFGVTTLNFRIFNRWGQLVFETNDVRIGWDGRYNGKEQPLDVYGYTLEAELLTGEKIRKAGNITLVR